MKVSDSATHLMNAATQEYLDEMSELVSWDRGLANYTLTREEWIEVANKRIVKVTWHLDCLQLLFFYVVPCLSLTTSYNVLKQHRGQLLQSYTTFGFEFGCRLQPQGLKSGHLVTAPCVFNRSQARTKAWFGIRESFNMLDSGWSILKETTNHISHLRALATELNSMRGSSKTNYYTLFLASCYSSQFHFNTDTSKKLFQQTVT